MPLLDRLAAFLRLPVDKSEVFAVSSAPSMPAAPEAAAPVALAFRDSVWDRNLVPSGEKILPDQLVRWLRSAETGETGYLHAFYDEFRARVPDVEVELGKAESRLAGARINVLPWPESLRSRTKEPSGEGAVAAAVAAYVKDVLTAPDARLGIGRGIAALSKGFWKGIGAFAPTIVPDPVDPTRERIASIKVIPTQRFRWDDQTGALLLQLSENRDDVAFVDVLVATGQLVVLQTEEDVPSPARRGLMRRLLSLAIGLLYGPGWWSRFVELYGIPVRVGYHPRGDEKSRADLVEGLRTMGAEAFAALPEGAKLEILDAVARSGSAEVHQTFAEFAARTIAKLVNGASQTTDIQQGTGSRASAGVHENVANERHRDRAREIAAVLRAQLAFGLVARKFGWETAVRYTPEIVLDVDGLVDLVDFAAGLKGLKDAGAGAAVPLSIVNERTNIPAPEPGEPTLADAPAPAPGAGRRPDDDEGKGEGRGETPEGRGAGPAREEAAFARRTPDPAAELDILERFADRQAALFGYEVIEPVRQVVDEAVREGWTLEQTFAALMARADLPPSSPRFVDALAAVQLEATMRGIVSERDRARIA